MTFNNETTYMFIRYPLKIKTDLEFHNLLKLSIFTARSSKVKSNACSQTSSMVETKKNSIESFTCLGKSLKFLEMSTYSYIIYMYKNVGITLSPSCS